MAESNFSLGTSGSATQNPVTTNEDSTFLDSEASKTAKRISVTLAPDTVDRLKKLAHDKNITFTEALRRAVATEVYLQNEIQKGSKILIQKADDTLREVTFR